MLILIKCLNILRLNINISIVFINYFSKLNCLLFRIVWKSSHALSLFEVVFKEMDNVFQSLVVLMMVNCFVEVRVLVRLDALFYTCV